MATSPEALIETHAETLTRARQAIRERTAWSHFPESPSTKVYGVEAKTAGDEGFEALKGTLFQIEGHAAGAGALGGETSPFGLELNVTYPRATAAELLDRAEAARGDYAAMDPKARLAVCVEILTRLNRNSYLIAHAVQHTTGQAYVMAFQAGAAHAQDRGLEAVAYAAEAIDITPPAVMWEKQTGKDQISRIEKSFVVVPRGIALLLGCSTFPTWNGLPGLFASLATGNPVIVKPSPSAILPLAITVKIAREVLAEVGLPRDVVQLAVTENTDGVTQALVTDKRVKLIDYTGSTQFGDWVEQNAPQARVFAEKAGVNSVILESTDNFKGVCRNLAFSLSLYSGQMCTAPQNIYVPAAGLQTEDGVKTPQEVAQALALGVSKLLGEPARGAAVLGALHADSIPERMETTRTVGEVVLPGDTFTHPDFPQARSRLPMIVLLPGADDPAAQSECFGPISFVIPAADREAAVSHAAGMAQEVGALTASLYSTDEAFITDATRQFAMAGAPLSINFTGGIHVNQSVAFSDFHGSGANPAANAALTDLAFVASRFAIVTVRRDRS